MPWKATALNLPPPGVQSPLPAAPNIANTRRGSPSGCPGKRPHSIFPRQVSSHPCLPPPTSPIPVGAALVGALESDRTQSSPARCPVTPACRPNIANTRRGSPSGCPGKRPHSIFPRQVSSHPCLPPPTSPIPVGAALVGALESDRTQSSPPGVQSPLPAAPNIANTRRGTPCGCPRTPERPATSTTAVIPTPRLRPYTTLPPFSHHW